MGLNILPFMQDPDNLKLFGAIIPKEEDVRWHRETANSLPNFRTGCPDLTGGLSEHLTLCLDSDDNLGCDRSAGGTGDMGCDPSQIASGRW